MKISTNGIALIKKWEKCHLVAYKATSSEEYYTIGYGHYGADVKKGMKITQAQADAYLVSDLAKFEAKVEKYNTKYHFNENQFSALVSFAYNIGNIDQLTANGTRTIAQISQKILAYNTQKGKVLAGLTNRRKEEKALFDTKVISYVDGGINYAPVFDPTYYADHNDDVKDVCGNNASSLLKHFVVFGMAEGRQAKETFNVQFYKANYKDLRTKFGNNLKLYYQHYVMIGLNENRTADKRI